MIEVISGAALALGAVAFCEVIRRISLRGRREECEHPTLSRYGKNSVACVSCDRVWRLKEPQNLGEGLV